MGKNTNLGGIEMEDGIQPFDEKGIYEQILPTHPDFEKMLRIYCYQNFESDYEWFKEQFFTRNMRLVREKMRKSVLHVL